MLEAYFLLFFIGSLWAGGSYTIIRVPKSRRRDGSCPPVKWLKTVDLAIRSREKGQVTKETSFRCVFVLGEETSENKELTGCAELATSMLLAERNSHVYGLGRFTPQAGQDTRISLRDHYA